MAKRSSEVDLQEIYEIAAPGASQEDIQELINEEVSEEIRVCFSYAPVVDVLLEAKRLGKKVIIVSDTYLREGQLRTLLSASLSPFPKIKLSILAITIKSLDFLEAQIFLIFFAKI